jgi:hypothetical protein
LHGTQTKLGLFEKYGSKEALEVHVKDFMLRHAKMLGLDNPHDLNVSSPNLRVTPSSTTASSSSLFKLFESHKLQKTANFNQVAINASKSAEIYHGYGDLSVRQAKLLENISRPDSIKLLHKSDVSVSDLAALTAKTGDEFAMFTLGSRRMILRGDRTGIDLGDFVPKLKSENWTWSAHTHPGTRDITLNASGIPGDRQVLQALEQERSLILNSAGRRNVFDPQNDMHVSNQTVNSGTKIKFGSAHD